MKAQRLEVRRGRQPKTRAGLRAGLLWSLLAGCGQIVLDERDGNPDASALANDAAGAGGDATRDVDASDATTPQQPLTGCVVAAIRGDEVLLASPSGQEHVLARDPVWNEPFTAAWRLGDRVLLSATGQQLASLSPGTWMALVDRERGLVWQGRAPQISDYLPTKGFEWWSREGYLLLSDGSVVDRDGTRHVVPEDGFGSTRIAIDASGHLLVQRGETLAYWNVAQDTLEPLSARGLSAAVVGPEFLGERETMQAAFVEQSDDGFALVRVDHRSHDRVALTDAANQAIAAALAMPSTSGTESRVRLLEHANAALLMVDDRPVGWAGLGQQPKALSDADFPPQLTAFEGQGGCFAAASRAATSAEELLLSLVRVHAGDGAVERGTRARVPDGLLAVLPSDPNFDGLPAWAPRASR